MSDGYKEEFDIPEEADSGESEILEDLPEDEPTEKPNESDVTIEALAAEMGWKPKDDFQGHEDDYVDAATYIRRSKDIQDSLRQHLKDNKRKMTSLEKGLEDLRLHNERVFKAQLRAQKEEIETLKTKRREAIEEGDVDLVEKIEEKMTKLSEDDVGKTEQEIDPEQYTVFSSWLKDNQWYALKGVTEGNSELTEYADNLSEMPEYQAMPYNMRLKKVGEKVKEMFPDQFPGNGKRKPSAPSVEAPKLRDNKKKFSARDLNEDQKKIMRNFAQNGIMSEQEYIDDLAKMGELG